MINHKAARDKLTEIIKAAAPDDISVQRAGFDAVASFPSVVIGMPAWTPVDNLPYGIQRSTWPIAAVVARNAQDSTTIDQLEELWPAVLEHLRTTTERDPQLGGVCSESIVTRADFGQFAIQGTSYPAQLVFIELYG